MNLIVEQRRCTSCVSYKLSIARSWCHHARPSDTYLSGSALASTGMMPRTASRTIWYLLSLCRSTSPGYQSNKSGNDKEQPHRQGRGTTLATPRETTQISCTSFGPDSASTSNAQRTADGVKSILNGAVEQQLFHSKQAAVE